MQLDIAPQVDSVRVVGSAIDVPASEQASSWMSSRAESSIRQRTLCDGPAARPSRRGVQSKRRARRRDQPVHARRQFQLQPGADRWRSRQLLRRRIRFRPHPVRSRGPHRVHSGAQSAVYGSYANAGVIDFVTRQPGTLRNSMSWPRAAATASDGSASPARVPLSASVCLPPPRAT